MTTVEACVQIGQGIKVLIAAGVTDEFQAMIGATQLTLAGGTPEREALLAELRKP